MLSKLKQLRSELKNIERKWKKSKNIKMKIVEEVLNCCCFFPQTIQTINIDFLITNKSLHKLWGSEMIRAIFSTLRKWKKIITITSEAQRGQHNIY